MAGSPHDDLPYRSPNGSSDPAHSDEVVSPGEELTHERARELLLRQSGELLPAAEANALADHLLTCDECYRFAQDVAARQHRQPTP